MNKNAKVDRFSPYTTNMFIYAVHALQSRRRELLATYDHIRELNAGGYSIDILDTLAAMEDKIASIEEAILILKEL